jgi:predicted O-methyltransferase YrrM
MSLPRDIFTSVSYDEAVALAKLSYHVDAMEIGAWTGYSAITMALAEANIVHSVDWHRGDDHAGHDETLVEMWENIKRYDVQNRVIMHVGRSQDVLPLFRPRSFDLIFVDGYHSYRQVLTDISLSQPLLRDAGIIAFHDYGDERFEVTRAVDTVFPGEKELVGSLAIVRT